VTRVGPDTRDDLNELFDGECAYCDNPATTIDHFYPVVRGGQSHRQNILPCCSSCNSSKRDSDPIAWLDRAPAVKVFTIEYMAAMGAL
jgi:5-methylcytosine-specific restriction endonuclease McrA